VDSKNEGNGKEREYFFYEEEIGKYLKTTSGWKKCKGKSGGTDKYGFAALPGGKGYASGDFKYVVNKGIWWSATESSTDHNNAYRLHISYEHDGAYIGKYPKSQLYSVRCVQD